MTKHQKAIESAIADIGKHEYPMGSNTGLFVVECQRASWLGGTGWPWCRAANLKWRKQAGDTPGDGSPGAWDALARAEKRGEVVKPADYKKAQAGDEVIWNVGSGHASLLERFESVGGQVIVHTVDGNSADAVKRCDRPLSLVRGFICWPEAGIAAGEKRPFVQVVGGESGRRKLVVGAVKVPLPAVKATKEKIT